MILYVDQKLLRKDWPLIRKHWDKWGAKDYWGDFNLLLGAKLINLKIYELKVKYHDRKYGETKMTKVFIQFLRMMYISINGFFKLYNKKTKREKKTYSNNRIIRTCGF